MKKLLLILAVVFGSIAIQSCEGSDGPQGPPGPTAEVIELRNYDFTAASNYQKNIALNPRLFPGDVVVGYVLWETFNGQPVWRPMPQVEYFPNNNAPAAPNGELTYNYDFTINDINIFLQFNFDVTTVPGYTKNQTFRFVLVPGQNPVTVSKGAPAVDLNDYEAVIKYYKIDESKIRTVN
ncbi:hypothetical protein [Flavobacterium sp. '19STA2R22 D10 B1']|uniref:hypothetical protein n=1 Tax=Flavobacterium aerium TaxID=3037261 RepID=UPI00278C47E5|nr:hypothetical protein [Flavobacterium sp. '19STA2R22 D10 B1']